jgi:TonB family protein
MFFRRPNRNTTNGDRTTDCRRAIDMKRFVLSVAMLVTPGITFSGTDRPTSIEVVLQWSLSLDSTGEIVSLAPVNEDYQRVVREQLEPLIHHWHFTPGKLDGQPAATETTVTLNVALDPIGDDQFRVRIVSAHTGATYKHVVATEYPKSAIHMRRQGEVPLRIDYDADGHITTVTPLQEKEAPWVDGSLKRAAVASAKQWTMRPETVAGHGVAGAAIAPFCFSLVKVGDHSEQVDRCRHTPSGDRPAGSPPLTVLASVVGIDMGAADHFP